MNKPYIDDRHMWHNESVHRAVCSLVNKYDNAALIFGTAVIAFDYINCDEPDYKKFINRLRNVAYDAADCKWHEGVVGAVRRFCDICLADITVIEALTDMSIEEFCDKYSVVEE